MGLGFGAAALPLRDATRVSLWSLALNHCQGAFEIGSGRRRGSLPRAQTLKLKPTVNFGKTVDDRWPAAVFGARRDVASGRL